MSERNIYLHKIATVVPEHFYTQDFALQYIIKVIGDTKKKINFLRRVYRDTGIDKRHTVIGDYGKNPEDFNFYPKNDKLLPEPTTKQRNDLYITESNKLSLKAVKELFNKLTPGVKEKITHIITVSCTGFSAPGFDFHIVKSLKLSPSIDRFNIGFMGCYAAFPAMKLACDICKANKEARVLIVNVELCSIHVQRKFDPDTIIANAIFSDGISAALISSNKDDSENSKYLINSFFSYFIPDSEDDMAWKIGNHGFDMKLSYYVPKLIKTNILTIIERSLKNAKLTMDQIDIWAIHPGGKAILEKLQDTLGIRPDDLSVSYEVLREYGNMSSSTIMFVLNNILQNDNFGNVFAVGFGPGLTVETGHLTKIS
jgi:predicted naringenin-chalcone synthase